MSYIEIENAEWAIENGELVEDIHDLMNQFDGGYAVSVGEQGHIWVYNNAFDAATDTCGHNAQLVVTHCGDLYAQFEGGGYIGTEGPKAHELAEDLDELLATFKTSAETGYVTISDQDMANLPTFGTRDLSACAGPVWSWDDERAIIGESFDELRIVNYRTLTEIWEAADEGEHVAFDVEYVKDYSWEIWNIDLDDDEAGRIVFAQGEWLDMLRKGEASESGHHYLIDKYELNSYVFGV